MGEQNYCCFISPSPGNSSRTITDTSQAGYRYDFPLTNCPQKIGKFDIVRPIARGFYSVTYYVLDTLLNQPRVLKVVPKKLYQVFEKNFADECKQHAALAVESRHIVEILDQFEDVVDFPDVTKLDCHVAVLQYVKGSTLEEILHDHSTHEPTKVAQIAIDLFTLLHELKVKRKFHNDLHYGNIIVKELSEEERRPDQVNPRIRVIAIDLGSISEESKSRDPSKRIGDIHRVSFLLQKLSEHLLRNPTDQNDNSYKLAYLLSEQSRYLMPSAENTSDFDYIEACNAIKSKIYQTYSPWKEPFHLKRFDEYYNAQSMHAWNVPSLFVDPNNTWINDISSKGPLIITGMRGCGKTMLLRTLQFHARAVPTAHSEEQNAKLIIDRIKSDGFIGLYVNSKKLLDQLGRPKNDPLQHPYAKLFYAYCIEAIEAIRHLSDIAGSSVENNYYKILIKAVSNSLADDSVLNDIRSDKELEDVLIDMMFSLNKGDGQYQLSIPPTQAFANLADSVKKCSADWRGHHVLFLLDDVSTRYFDTNNILDFLSVLMFQSPICAFKITSEEQTIQFLLNSPGNIEKARLGRDFDRFDLGNEVHNILQEGKKEGTKFIENILLRRAKFLASHPRNQTPSEILGDSTLENIARRIGFYMTQGEEKKKKKEKDFYYGITALKGICVGDIGEVVQLYEEIFGHFKNQIPIDPVKQSECFTNRSAIRLFQLNRKSTLDLKRYAISFAEAAHELLIKSYKETPDRLREYHSIYVDISALSLEAQEECFRKLLDLIDAGIFVFLGGAAAPRATSRGTNPIKQFVLLYRKIYGVSYLMGLRQADRFEFNGERLIDWLNDPLNGKKILMEGLGFEKFQKNKQSIDSDWQKPPADDTIKSIAPFAPTLFDESHVEGSKKEERARILVDILPSIKKIEGTDLIGRVDTMVVALGFEDRALISIERSTTFRPKKVLLIRYNEKKNEANESKIISFLEQSNTSFRRYPYNEFGDLINDLERLPQSEGVYVDVSGLSKSLIFDLVRRTVTRNTSVYIAHTMARVYAPSDEQVSKILEDFGDTTGYNLELFQERARALNSGELGPYSVESLLIGNSNELKPRVLFAFSTSRFDRLFTLLEERDFDYIEIVTTVLISQRAKLADIAANVIHARFSHSSINHVDTYNLSELFAFMSQKYYEYYFKNGYNVELALTGSKRETVVAALLSTVFKFSQVWYVKPTEFDTTTYSEGALDSEYYEISIEKLPRNE